jgi:2'-5' RNA ligase
MSAKPRRPPKERPPDPHAAGAPWRLFIAVAMPSEAQVLIERVVASLEADAPVRWTAAGSSHLTLHFLGEIDPSRAELLRLAFPNFTRGQQAFALRTGAPGCFPDAGPPKVVWLGLAGDTRALTALHKSVGRQLAQFAIEPEERAFRPHITLGRVRAEATPAQASALRAHLRDPDLNQRALDESVVIPVDEIHLMRSFLERTGARYETVATARLRPPD